MTREVEPVLSSATSRSAQLPRRTLALMDDADLEPDSHKAAAFLRDRFRYHRGFRHKWKVFAARYPGSVAWIEYDDLTGSSRIDTLNDLVAMIGIEPRIPVADVARDVPVMTDHDRRAEKCSLADRIMFDNRTYLDQCNEFMVRLGIETPPWRTGN